MHPRGANKNNDDHAIFSKDGPNQINPELTNNPSVIPNRYKLMNKIKSIDSTDEKNSGSFNVYLKSKNKFR